MKKSAVVGLAFLALLVIFAVFGASGFRSTPWDGTTQPVSTGKGWPQFRSQSALSLREFGVRGGTRRPWEFKTQGLIWSTPVIDEAGIAYIGSTDRHFYALSPEGKQLWDYPLFDRPDAIVDSAALLMEDGTVIIPGGDGYLHAVDRGTGARRWLFKAYHAQEGSEKLVNSFEGNVGLTPEGLVIAPSDNGIVYAVDPKRVDSKGMAAERWHYVTHGRQFLWSLPAISPDQRWMAFGSLDKKLYLLNPKNGKELAVLEVGGEVKSSPVMEGVRGFYVGASNGDLLAMDVIEKQGRFKMRKRWKVKTGGEIYSSPALHRDLVIVGSHDGKVYAVERASGKVRWAYQTGDRISASPAISADGVILIGNAAGHLFAIDGDTGTRLWSYFVADRHYKVNLDASPGLSPDGRVVVGSYDGKIYSVPYEYCLRTSDPRCTTDPGHAVPDYARHGSREDGTTLLVMDSNGEFRSEPSAPVQSNEVLKFRILRRENGEVVKNAGIAHWGLDVKIEPPVPFRVSVSPDNTFLNVMPETFWKSGMKYRVRVQARHFSRGHLVLDYVKLPFSKTVKEMSFEVSPDVGANWALAGRQWNMTALYAQQPAAFDTLMPAAMDGQAYLLTVLHADPSADAPNERFVLLVNHATPTVDGPVVISEPRHSFVLDGVRSGNAIKASGKFFFTAMGAGTDLDEFQLSGQLDSDGRLSEGIFFGTAPCSALRSNDSTYSPPLNVVYDLCGAHFVARILGTFRGDRMAAPKKPSFELLRKEVRAQDATFELRSLGAKAPRVYGLTAIDPKTSRALEFQGQKVELDGKGRLSFRFAKPLPVGTIIVLTGNSEIIARGEVHP